MPSASELHGGAPRGDRVGVDRDLVADISRGVEHHAVDRDGHATPAGPPGGGSCRAARTCRTARSRRYAAAGHGIPTFLGFVLAGLVPLLAYLLPWFDGARFAAATALALATLFAVGASRALFTGCGRLASGLEMLLVGALATAVAYGVGALGASLIG